MQTINLNPLFLSELFDLISQLNSEFPIELYGFEITEKSMTCKSFSSLDPDDLDSDLDDLIANWMDHVEDPKLFYTFSWEINIENKSLTFNW